MYRMISVLFVATLAIAGSVVCAPRTEASPLIPAAPLAQAVAGANDAVTPAYYRYRRHYGWYHRPYYRHYGYYHRPYYRHYGYYHRPYYRHYGYHRHYYRHYY
jgi:hypothetical protein